MLEDYTLDSDRNSFQNLESNNHENDSSPDFDGDSYPSSAQNSPSNPQQAPHSNRPENLYFPGRGPPSDANSSPNRPASVFERFLLSFRHIHRVRSAPARQADESAPNTDPPHPISENVPVTEPMGSNSDQLRTILITLNYMFSDQNEPQNPNRLGSLIISIPNNPANREPHVIQEFIRLATRVAYSGIINNLQKKRGITKEAFDLLPLVTEVGECTECPICFEQFNMDHIIVQNVKVKSETRSDRDLPQDLLRKRRKLSPDRLSDDLNYTTPSDSPLLRSDTPVSSTPASPSSFAPRLPRNLVAPHLARSSSVPDVLRNAPLAANIPRAPIGLRLRPNGYPLERSSSDGHAPSNPRYTNQATAAFLASGDHTQALPENTGEGQGEPSDSAPATGANGETEVEYKHAPVKLPCDHIFGRNCLYEWLKDNPSCPLCRAQVPTGAQNQSGRIPNPGNADNSIANLLNGGFTRANLGSDSPTDAEPDIQYFTISAQPPMPPPEGSRSPSSSPVGRVTNPPILRSLSVSDVLHSLINQLQRPDVSPDLPGTRGSNSQNLQPRQPNPIESVDPSLLSTNSRPGNPSDFFQILSRQHQNPDLVFLNPLGIFSFNPPPVVLRSDPRTGPVEHEHEGNPASTNEDLPPSATEGNQTSPTEELPAFMQPNSDRTQ